VAFDSWYSGFPGLKQLRGLKWDWLTQLKSNREVSIDHTGNSSIREIWRRRRSGSGYVGNIFLLSISKVHACKFFKFFDNSRRLPVEFEGNRLHYPEDKALFHLSHFTS
jgi:hypothetical protein